MGDRTSHDAGTISWSDLATTDQDAAKEFYGGLFGWKYDEQPIDDDTTYSMGKLGDRVAAAISPQQSSESEAGIRRTGTSTGPSTTAPRPPARGRRPAGRGRRGPSPGFHPGRRRGA